MNIIHDILINNHLLVAFMELPPLAKKALLLIVPHLINAAWMDWDAFKKFQSFNELANYDFKTASFRWFKGLMVGLVTFIAASYNDLTGSL